MVKTKPLMKTVTQCTVKFQEMCFEGAKLASAPGKKDFERLNQVIGWLECLQWVRGMDYTSLEATRPRFGIALKLNGSPKV